VSFLQWVLPRLGMRWQGFRRVRRQVCRRILSRAAELGLDSFDAYRGRLEADPDEWRELEPLCRVTISRFLRDREAFRRLGEELLPELAAAAVRRGAERLLCWSAGCASGEEPYSLALAWRLGPGAARFPARALAVLATDIDLTLLARARRARYQASSLRELPDAWRDRAFEREGGLWRLLPEHRRGVLLAAHDVRTAPPAAAFDLILCRNLVFTYLAEREQRKVGERLLDHLVPGGALVVGGHESLPEALAAELEETVPCVHRHRVARPPGVRPGRAVGGRSGRSRRPGRPRRRGGG